MHPVSEVNVKPISDYIWIGKNPFPFEAVKEFLVEAERLRKTHPRALYSVLLAARDGESLNEYADEFPSNTTWLTDYVAHSTALALGPIFYTARIAQPGVHGNIPRQIENAVDALDCDMSAHREMLRIILEGYF